MRKGDGRKGDVRWGRGRGDVIRRSELVEGGKGKRRIGGRVLQSCITSCLYKKQNTNRNINIARE